MIKKSIPSDLAISTNLDGGKEPSEKLEWT
jgi:hypothetical protein